MRKVLVVVLALALTITALGVLTVAEDIDQEEVAVVEAGEDEVEVSVLPEAFAEGGALEGEGGTKEPVDNEQVTVKVDPVHVTE